METPTRAKAFPLPALCALFVAVLQDGKIGVEKENE
jgi:hypothetical protein